MKINKQLLGHFSVFFAYLIFGFNIVICKNIANLAFVSPLGLFFLRSLGAATLFWLVSLFLPKEKIAPRDYIRIFVASMLGLFITQIAFLKGITLTAPLDGSVLSVMTPIFTMFVAAIVLKEPITLKKAGGVALSFIGVLVLILNSTSLSNGVGQTHPLGAVLFILNTFTFALYLGIFRPLIMKYSVVTFMKWMFLFALLVSFPFCISEMISLDYAAIPSKFYWEVGYMVFFSTFIAYFLIPIGQKHLRPTVVSLYSYIQPIVASITSIYLGMDSLNWVKITASVAIISGVILVNRSRAKTEMKK